MMNLEVELWPGGDKDNKKVVGQIALANVSGLRAYSNYVVAVLDDNGVRWLYISDHYRPDGMWILYYRILDAIVNEENWQPVPEKYKRHQQAIAETLSVDS